MGSGHAWDWGPGGLGGESQADRSPPGGLTAPKAPTVQATSEAEAEAVGTSFDDGEAEVVKALAPAPPCEKSIDGGVGVEGRGPLAVKQELRRLHGGVQLALSEGDLEQATELKEKFDALASSVGTFRRSQILPARGDEAPVDDLTAMRRRTALS